LNKAQGNALRLTVWDPAVVTRVAIPYVHLARREAFTGTARYSTSNGLQHNRVPHFIRDVAASLVFISKVWEAM